MKWRRAGTTVAILVGLIVAALDAAPSAMAATRQVTFTAQVVSYDLAVGSGQRVLVGLLAGNEGLVAFGNVEFDFEYLGTEERPLDAPAAGPTTTATYMLVAGFTVDDPPSSPRLFKPSQAIGVYAADDVAFDRAGQWRVTTSVRFGKKTARVPTTFTVVPKHRVIAVGATAPRTENPLAGSTTTPARAVDSRASTTVAAPDPALHMTSIASSLAAGIPTVVVVSTPTFCISQFCGPITDSADALAREYEGRVAFVHLEVWRNYPKQVVNAAAAEWILPNAGHSDANEPWVFMIDAAGVVQQRFDNVVSDSDLRAAVEAIAS